MNIEQIKQVIVVAALGSINKGAKELYISQPNLSLSIKKLEAELQNPIFKRSRKGVELTPFGHEFLAYAQPIYQQFKYLETFCASISENATLNFSVSSQYFKFASSIFIQIYNKYKDNNIKFTFKEEPFLKVITSVYEQQSEIGILLLSGLQKKMLLHLLKSRGLEYYLLSLEKASVILGPQNPLYKQKIAGVTRQMIKPYTFVSYIDEQYNFSAEWHEIGMFNPDNRILVSDRATMNDILANTQAYTIGIHSWNAYKNTQYYTNLKAFPLLDYEVPIELGWISNKSRPLSPIAKEYITLIKNIL